MAELPARATIERDGWEVVSAEERTAASPDNFVIASRAEREALTPGTVVKLLFDIETRRNGEVWNRIVQRMWVLIKSTTQSGYVGVLDNQPGEEGSTLRRGQLVFFGPEHVADIFQPPRS
jgi:hypothetical protein